ncbi:DUF5667 domain-containing protein [Frankia sp. AgPm24]|uniref:DUF5667 domain-containing protein n=1 Tax=Frankia sp. AgPm24 TaxID=631128 RepID=UPI00200F2468|nr:DUF5667 domain-containing protein [Frankia sp. AgPm24]MCK9922589.1 DUF5667 domain-containing protein [Frankia sp. AgPm24]
MRAARRRDRVSGTTAPSASQAARPIRRLLSRRARADQADRFAALLEGHTSPTGPQEARLLALADAARSLPRPRLDPVRRDAIRARILADLATATAAATADATATAAESPGRARRPHGNRVRAAVRRAWAGPSTVGVPRLAQTMIAAGLSVAIAVIGLALSARDALPGEPLYRVKRQVEDIQVSLERDPVARAKTRLDVAGVRMSELRLLTIGAPAALGGRPSIGSPTRRPTTGRPGSLPLPLPAAPATAPTGPSTSTSAVGPTPPAGPLGPAAPVPTPTAGPGAPTGAVGPLGSAPATTSTRPPVSASTSEAPSTSGAPSTSEAPSNPSIHGMGGHHADAGTINKLLWAWCAQARAAAQVLLARADAGNLDAWRALATFTADQNSSLAVVITELPPGTTDAAHAAVDLIGQFRRGLGPTPPGTFPTAPRLPSAPAGAPTAPATPTATVSDGTPADPATPDGPATPDSTATPDSPITPESTATSNGTEPGVPASTRASATGSSPSGTSPSGTSTGGTSTGGTPAGDTDDPPSGSAEPADTGRAPSDDLGLAPRPSSTPAAGVRPSEVANPPGAPSPAPTAPAGSAADTGADGTISDLEPRPEQSSPTDAEPQAPRSALVEGTPGGDDAAPADNATADKATADNATEDPATAGTSGAAPDDAAITAG